MRVSSIVIGVQMLGLVFQGFAAEPSKTITILNAGALNDQEISRMQAYLDRDIHLSVRFVNLETAREADLLAVLRAATEEPTTNGVVTVALAAPGDAARAPFGSVPMRSLCANERSNHIFMSNGKTLLIFLIWPN